MYRSGSLGRKGLPFVRLPCFFSSLIQREINDLFMDVCRCLTSLALKKSKAHLEKIHCIIRLNLQHSKNIILFPYIFQLSQQISIGFNRVSVGQPLRFRWSFAARGVRIMIDIPSAGRMESLHQI